MAKRRHQTPSDIRNSKLNKKVIIIGGAVIPKVSALNIGSNEQHDFVFEQRHLWSVKMFAFYEDSGDRTVIDDLVYMERYYNSSELNFAMTKEMVKFIDRVKAEVPELIDHLVSTGYVISPSHETDLDSYTDLAIDTLTKAGCYDRLISGIGDAGHRAARASAGYYKRHPEHKDLRINK